MLRFFRRRAINFDRWDKIFILHVTSKEKELLIELPKAVGQKSCSQLFDENLACKSPVI